MSTASMSSGPRFPERWVRFYTRGLPQHVRDERRDEISSDVYEHWASEPRAPERSVRVAVVGRTLRGVAGDVMWRFEEGRAMKQHEGQVSGRPTGMHAAWATVTQSWFTPIAVLVGITDIAFAIWVVLDDQGKMPGQAIGPVFLVGFAAAMFTGLWLRWRSQFGRSGLDGARPAQAHRPVSGTSLLIGLAVMAVAFLVVGAMTSPLPMIVGLALLVVVGVVAVAAMRRPRSEGQQAAALAVEPSWRPAWLADALIVAGTLPALALFWFVIPAILALVVIGGVIGTQPGARSRVPA